MITTKPPVLTDEEIERICGLHANHVPIARAIEQAVLARAGADFAHGVQQGFNMVDVHAHRDAALEEAALAILAGDEKTSREGDYMWDADDCARAIRALKVTPAAVCATCKGSGVVPDGEITGSGGVPYENGPVQCVTDCPACTPAAAVADAPAAGCHECHITHDLGACPQQSENPGQVADAQPVAWMVPSVLSFNRALRTNCPAELQAELEGVVKWEPSLIGDRPPVVDKFGVTHRPSPLVYAAQPSAQAQPLAKDVIDCLPLRLSPENGYDAAWCAGFNDGVRQSRENIERIYTSFQAQPSGAAQDLEHAKADVVRLTAQIRLLEEQIKGEVWRWQGDGTDDLASMGNRMGVLIHACDLRALLSQAQPSGNAGEVDATKWQGWATQKPDRLPKLWGARHIAALNWDEDGDADLIRLVEVERIAASKGANHGG
jgi:hypothetical protein